MNSPSSIDVTNSTTNKGTGINHVKEVLNFTGQTFAFGDGRNDGGGGVVRFIQSS